MTGSGQAFIIEYVSPDIPPTDVFPVAARQLSNSALVGGSEIRVDISSSRVEPRLVWACRAGGEAIALQMILTRYVSNRIGLTSEDICRPKEIAGGTLRDRQIGKFCPQIWPRAWLRIMMLISNESVESQFKY